MTKPDSSPPKRRRKSIKIRVSDEELAHLRALSSKDELAVWMRELCLGAPSPDPEQAPEQGPKVDPALLRQLAGIGNNINQMARRLNATEALTALEKVRFLGWLTYLGRELEGVRRDHQVP